MKKQTAITKVEEKQIKDYLYSEFTIGNALSANLLAVIAIFFALFMLNAVVFNSYELIPQQPFTEFVAERFEYYAQQNSLPEQETDNLISQLISQFIVILIKIVIDALEYILYGVQKEQVFTVASIIFITNIAVILLIYLILYRRQVRAKTLIISLILGIFISCILLNLIAFFLISLSLSPVLVGFLGGWILLPTTTISIPLLFEWVTEIEGIWIAFWYLFAFILSTIVSISIFIGSRFDRKKLPEATTEKLKKLKEKDDNWLWFFISSIVVSIVSVLWKFFGRIVVEFFAAYKSVEELELGEGSKEYWIGGVKLNVLNAQQIFILYFILITIGYAVGFMLAYSLYRRAAGQKNWLELYKARHPSRREQLIRWLVYTTLMSLYWMYSIYFPRHLFPSFDWVQTVVYSAIITVISILAGKLAILEVKKRGVKK